MKKRSKWRNLDIGCATSLISCNLALEKMWKREFNFKTGEWGWLLNDLSKRTKKSHFYQESTREDKFRLFSNQPLLRFTSDEERIGEEFLLRNNISKHEKIVCLNVRDSAFLSKSEPLNWSKSRDWSYHNFRDSEIKTYVAAAETLADMGYTVFRMGAIVKEPFVSKHPRVIDYATNGMRTEFLDIYLGGKCTFCVSTGSGWDDLPIILRRPTMFVNFLPIFIQSAHTLPITIFPKILVDKRTNDELTLMGALSRNVIDSSLTAKYASAGVVIRDMNSDELVEAVTEMAARVEGTFVETLEQKQLQAKLKLILSTHPKLQPTRDYYPIRAEFASCFLSNYPNFLD